MHDDKNWFIYEEIKLFPSGHPHYISSCVDLRLGLGLVQKISPEFNLGFRISGGVRLGLPFEVTYQFFPQILGKENWEDTIFLSVPISF